MLVADEDLLTTGTRRIVRELASLSVRPSALGRANDVLSSIHGDDMSGCVRARLAAAARGPATHPPAAEPSMIHPDDQLLLLASVRRAIGLPTAA